LGVPGELVENISLPLATYVRMFLRNRLGRALDDAEESFAERFAPPGVKNGTLSPPVQRRLAMRFFDGNRKLSLRHGVPEIALDEDVGAAPPSGTPSVDLLFSERSELMSFGGVGAPSP
jgi:hypothetical protein